MKLRERERNAFACIERHQAFALAPVWCDPRADARGTGSATHRISSCPLLASFASTSRMRAAPLMPPAMKLIVGFGIEDMVSN